MKHLSTKTIGSLLSAASSVIGTVGRVSDDKHFDRILRRHDRKGELRAAILGMKPEEFRQKVRGSSFEQIIRRHGFKGFDDFLLALIGKLREELLHRGWSRQKIDGLTTGSRFALA